MFLPTVSRKVTRMYENVSFYLFLVDLLELTEAGMGVW